MFQLLHVVTIYNFTYTEIKINNLNVKLLIINSKYVFV